MKTTRFAKPIRSSIFLLLLLMAPAAVLAAECGLNTPAFPVDSALWPENFSPVRPGERIPARRDSTDWTTQTDASYTFGHELYAGVDTLDDYLYVAYSTGIQAWRIDPNDPKGNLAELPEFVAFKDGWLGHFMHWSVNHEIDQYIEEVAVIRLTSNEVIVAASGRTPVGFTLWKFKEDTEVFERIYQHTDEWSYQVRIAEVGGRIYAFSSRTDGVAVYDVNEALSEAPCLEEATATIECPGVLKGMVGSTAHGIMDKGRYLDILQTTGPAPKLFLTATDGTDNTNIRVEVFEITNPQSPGTSTRKFSGLSSYTFGTSMFEHGGNYYFAAIERIGSTNKLKFFNFNNCITNPTCTLGSTLAEISLLPFTSRQFLSFSRSGATPFLYYGGVFTNLSLTQGVEMLLDLTELQPTGSNQQGNFVEVSGEETITESAECGSSTVDYWGSYYPSTEGGYRNLSPRRGKFHGQYFYRAAHGILDIHKLSGPIVQNPELTTTVQASGPLYMNEDIRFTASAENCDPSVWDWTFDPGTEIPTITDVSCANGSATCQSDIRFDYCNPDNPPCADRQIRVIGENASCDDPSNSGALVTIEEPRAHVDGIQLAIGGGAPGPVPATVNVCTAIEFSALIGGKPEVDGQNGFNYSWDLIDEGGGSVASASGLEIDTLSWETVLSSPVIFMDGFESGNTSAWGTDQVTPETFRIELQVENTPDDSGMNFTTPIASETFQVTGLDPLTFDAKTPINTPTGAFGGDFEANTSNATEWRWIIEDPTNANTNCNRSDGSSTGYTNCRVIEWATNTRQITHEWSSEVPSGDYRVTVEAKNCENPVALFREATVTITGVVLAVTNFRIDVATTLPNCDSLCQIEEICGCRPNVDITFVVEANGDPDGYQFDWEGTGNWTGAISAASPSFVHQYASNGQRTPAIRAVKAGFDNSAAINLRVPADSDADQSINVQP